MLFRSLYREVLRIARVVRPKYLFLENVAAIVTNGLGTVLGDLAALGYDSEWLCLRASDCGAKHHRDRWWLLAHASRPGQLRAQQLENYHKGKRNRGSTTDSNSFCEISIKDVPNSSSQRLEGLQLQIGTREEYPTPSSSCWWSVEPNVGRVANGVPHRVHRLKGLDRKSTRLNSSH